MRYRIRIGTHSFLFERGPDGRLLLEGRPPDAEVLPLGGGRYGVRLEGEVYTFVWETRQGQPGVLWRGRWYPVELKDERALLLERLGGPAGHAKGASRVLAPMPGLVLRVLVREGEPVRRGQPLLVLEAMKMENEIRAPAEGVVQRVHVQERQPVEKNALLVELG